MSIITETLGDIRIDEPLAYRSLTLFPLTRPVDGPPDYLTLTQALADGAATISEISESGSVPEILFENSADKPVLLVDGEELVGAKQNRILNLTILVPAKSSLAIPVSCVEAGRWAHREQHFSEADSLAFLKMRRRKARAVSMDLRAAGGRRASQAQVWSDIEDLVYDMKTDSPTCAMRDSFVQRQESLGQYVKALPAVDDQVGALFAANGKVVGLDLFDHPRTLASALPKLVRSHAMETLRASPVAEVTPPDAAQAFLSQVSGAPAENYPAIGEGEDLRLESEALVGGGLEARGRLIHLCAFAGEPGDDDTPRTRYARSASRRRAWRSTRQPR
ncbi:MAG TPA: hypothetical protein DG414_08950 [Gammaproteobacteria bacterium]|jgi:hypothetical protein|nr:hypothetical protein [Arenicellales bacterium]HCY13949.1 hypothetical protein [Gammaproteobacteria bacterium]|tara:strand:+ start:243 stop:1244 length:1002 start_codon:yes stop_codon:yes gene_type:complete